MRQKALLLGLAVGLLSGLWGGIAAAERPRVVQSAQLHDFNDAADLKDGAVLLWRNRNALWATLHASGLDSNAAYTIWIILFHRTERCESPPLNAPPEIRCGAGDLSAIPNQAKASAFWGGGFITDANGTANAQVHLYRGRLPEGTDVLWGRGGRNDNGIRPGLREGHGLRVEVHFVLRTHQGILNDAIADQIFDLNGGCPPHSCTNQVAAAFPAIE